MSQVSSPTNVELHNSLHEVVGAVDLAEAIGALDDAASQAILSLATRIKRMIRACAADALPLAAHDRRRAQPSSR